MNDWMIKARENANAWLKNSALDKDSRKKIENLLSGKNNRQLIDCFYKKLHFGTGGLRALMGIGSNRINRYTIAMATQGLSNYLNKVFQHEKVTIAIAYDSRNKSREFADITSQILSANGVFVYLFSELRPTPLLSFAVRYLNCHAGIVITASHNPKGYNGYKVYWKGGAQLIPPHDQYVMDEINSLSNFDQINFQVDKSRIAPIGNSLEEKYLEYVQDLFPDKETIKRQKKIPIVYSSLHGSGITMVPKCLSEIGFQNCVLVESQKTPDGDFPTVSSPNPEEPEAMKEALFLAKEVNAELVMATDPDADRVAIGIKEKKGNFLLLNGNQAFSLLAWFTLKNKKLKKKNYIVKTIVTTDLIDAIAARYGVDCYTTLTGFKYIAQQIDQWEGKKFFLLAGEESYGFLLGDFVRDKDGVSACASFAYMAALARDQGETLYDWLMQLYVEYGLYQEKLINLIDEGANGEKRIQEKMNALRTGHPTFIGNEKVVRVLDFKLQEDKNTTTGKTTPLSLPKSDVIQFYTEGSIKVSVRPSGTEPKIKFYISVNSKLQHVDHYESTSQKLQQKIIDIEREFLNK